jgi:hypothetical protein
MHDDQALLEEFSEAIDAIGGISAAEDFIHSLEEKFDSMSAFFDERGELTDAQRQAIVNMIDGARRWLRE